MPAPRGSAARSSGTFPATLPTGKLITAMSSRPRRPPRRPGGATGLRPRLSGCGSRDSGSTPSSFTTGWSPTIRRPTGKTMSRPTGDVRAPMEALLAELTPEFGPGFGEGKVFRPYRDVRFAKDKTPYKTHCGAVIEQGRGGGAYYVEVSSAGLRVGGGCFHLQSDQLARFRQAV